MEVLESCLSFSGFCFRTQDASAARKAPECTDACDGAQQSNAMHGRPFVAAFFCPFFLGSVLINGFSSHIIDFSGRITGMVFYPGAMPAKSTHRAMLAGGFISPGVHGGTVMELTKQVL